MSLESHVLPCTALPSQPNLLAHGITSGNVHISKLAADQGDPCTHSGCIHSGQ